ncbi:hypothetical protein [Nocardia aurantia]|uniref:hypothetical protein n=1 Tax=Nocardia aurantia TaxID=2585199 RepID=UPI0029E8167C|nr:hypothetical protein [Nocardia aurantia]
MAADGKAPAGLPDRPVVHLPGTGDDLPAVAVERTPGWTGAGETGPRASRTGVTGRGAAARRFPARRIGCAFAAVATVGLLTGCSSQHADDKVPAAAPASAAVSPPAARTPAGSVITAAPIAALLAVPGGGRLAELDTDGVTVHLLDLAPSTGTAGNPAPGATGSAPAAAPGSAAPAPSGPADPAAPGTPGTPIFGATRTVTLPAKTAALAPGAPGEVLAAAGPQILHLDTATGTVRATAIGADTRAVARRADGTLAVALADHRVLVVADDGHVLHTVTGLTGADSVAAAGDAVTVLDLAQTSLTELDLGHGRASLALRAGTGATGLIADHYQRLLVTDTAGGALLVYTPDPLVLRQRFPVGSSPYALAYDQRSETVWVTLTGSNEVAGFDLSTGIPEEVGRYATVRQPDSVTIDDRTGDMFVGSATGDGLQRIAADDRKRGQ